jgi:hypothetical protein
MSVVVPDWGVPAELGRPPFIYVNGRGVINVDTYGRHHWPADTCSAVDLEMLRRAEVARLRRLAGDVISAKHRCAA